MSTAPSSAYADMDLELMQQRAYDDVMAAIAAHAQPDYESATAAFAEHVGRRYEQWVRLRVAIAGALYWLVATPLLLQGSLWTLLMLPVLVTLAYLAPARLADRMQSRVRAAVAKSGPSQYQLQIATALVSGTSMRAARRWMAGSTEEMAQLLSTMASGVDCGTLAKHVVGCPHSRTQW